MAAQHTLSLQYAQPDESTQLYPAIQADNYQPKLKDKVSICLAESSYLLLSEVAKELLQCNPIDAEFGGKIITLYAPQANIKIIPLGMPKSFCYHKDSGKYQKIQAGSNFKTEGLISACKIHLCIVVDDILLTDDDGVAQVFTLNLKSSKTSLVKMRNSVCGDGSLFGWNESLKQAHKARGWIASLFGFTLSAFPQKFTSSVSGDSSIGTMFGLDNPDILHPAVQQSVFVRLQDQILKAKMLDPYNLKVAETSSNIDNDFDESIF